MGEEYRLWLARLARIDAMLDEAWSDELQHRYNEAMKECPKPKIMAETIANGNDRRLLSLVKVKMQEHYGDEDWNHYWKKFKEDTGQFSNLGLVIGEHMEVWYA